MSRAEGAQQMSIEIDILNGDAAWPLAKPLMDAVWPSDAVEKLPWGHVKWRMPICAC
jgi:hypothetical protein